MVIGIFRQSTSRYKQWLKQSANKNKCDLKQKNDLKIQSKFDEPNYKASWIKYNYRSYY